MADFYDVLGIPRTATKDDVKKAYRKAALKTHPDRVSPDQKKVSEDAFRAVNAAYEILHDDNNRALYDKYGKWPPPPPQAQPQYHQRPSPPSYQPATNVPLFYDHGRPYMPFTFTDPFTLFKSIFAELSSNLQQVQAAAYQRHPHQPPFPDPYGNYMPFPSFGQAAPAGTFAPNLTGQKPRPRHSSTSPPAPPSDPTRPRSNNNSDDETRGWVKESRVTKVTPQGTRETTIKKTAYDGTVYITRIAGDGTERHWVMVAGVEKSSPTGAPAVPPRIPLSQTQAQAHPNIPGSEGRPSPTHAATAPTPAQQVSESYRREHGRSQSHSIPQSSARSRSQQRSAIPPRGHVLGTDYRVASPTPMDASRTSGTHPSTYTYAKAPAPAAAPRVTSPTPLDPRQQRVQAEPRRHQSAPAPAQSYQAAPPPPPVVQPVVTGAPMPRPQSPHFYRTRVSPEKPPHSSATSTKPAKPSNLSSSTRVREDPSAYPFSDSEARPRATYGISSGYQSSAAATITRSGSTRPSRSSKTHPGVPEEYGVAAQGKPRMSSSRPQTQPTVTPTAVPPVPKLPTKSKSVPGPQAPMPVPENVLGIGFIPAPDPVGSITLATPAPPPKPFGRESRSSSFERIVYTGSDQPGRPMAVPPPYNPIPQPPQVVDPWSAHGHHRTVHQWQQPV